MQVGLQLPLFTWPGGPAAIRPRLAEIARTAEEAGFASLWVMDHFFQLPSLGEADEPMLEAFTTLGYLAAVTERIRLGPLVAGVVYRHPGILIKTATTLDVIAGGRTYLGIGAAWYDREARGLGVPYPPRSERFEQLEETLRIAQRMWRGEAEPFAGHHYRLAEPINQPLPLARPHPPIMIGGNGERRTLRLVARYGDACNFLVLEPHEIRAKLDVLRAHCEDVGRDPGEIEITALDEIDLRPGRMSVADVVARARAQAVAGVQHLIVNMPDAWDVRHLELLGREVVPQIERIAA